ncbi:MAG: TetR/AcrR family transcriptional regulator C-terminal domain-containing protein [Clostridia bacterium]|nr:TetR/AcrR family transcriptional regulator C-terminal domain-containing protein [Clostridia bacterium]
MHNPEHRVRATKKLLRDALLTLLNEKPLRNITVKELCARAGLNRGTFYAHYRDVYDLMEQIEEEMKTAFFAALEPVMSDAGQLSPPKMTKKIFECIEKNADLCRVAIGPYGDREFTRRLLRESRERSIQRCLQAFPNAEQWQIEAYFTFVTGGCYALMERWIRRDMKENSAELADAAEKIMEMGIAFLQSEK